MHTYLARQVPCGQFYRDDRTGHKTLGECVQDLLNPFQYN